MMLLHLLCFFWPPVIAIAFLGFFSKRIKSQGAFFVFATLVLFGMSRLISTEIVPLLVGFMPNLIPMNSIRGIHWLGQIVAALSAGSLYC